MGSLACGGSAVVSSLHTEIWETAATRLEVLLSSSGASEIAALVPSEVSGCNSARKDLANNNLRLRALEGQK